MLLAGPEIPAGELSQCPSGGLACLELGYQAACLVDEATAESCGAAIETLRQRPDADGAVARLVTAHAWRAMADLSEDPDARQRYRSAAIAAYEQLVAEDPSNAQALLALSVEAEDAAERQRLLRQIVAVAPSDVVALQSLAAELQQTGRIADWREAGVLLEQAYAIQTGMNKWHLAGQAGWAYRNAGEADRATALEARARRDIGLEGLQAELMDITGLGPRRAWEILTTLCYDAVTGLFGADACLSGIRAALDRSSAADATTEVRGLAEAAAAGMVTAARGGAALTAEDPDWHPSFLSQLEGLAARGIESAVIYGAYANLTLDPGSRLTALERAAALAPKDGDVAFRLAAQCLAIGRWQAAIEEFRRARHLISAGILPETWREEPDVWESLAEGRLAVIEMHLATARRALAEGAGHPDDLAYEIQFVREDGTRVTYRYDANGDLLSVRFGSETANE